MGSTERYLRLVRGEARGPAAMAARVGLAMAAVPYRVGVACRDAAYRGHLKRVYRVERPVVSVGNITLGGTGKTPTVEWVARWFRRRDARVVLLSRGYKGQGGLNDEGLVLDQNLPDVPHLQDGDRVRLARIAVDELEAEVLVLDDGFQHRRLARDLDIVLLDALCPFGHGRMFPRGLLREPISALRRAHIVILSRADLVDASTRERIRAEAERHAGVLAWAEAAHGPVDLVDGAGASRELGFLKGKRVMAFCGIGNPEGFRRTLGLLGVEVGEVRVFPDHHGYAREDVESLGRWARESGAELVLTTQKDLVKLRVVELGGVALFALRIGLRFLAGEDVVERGLARVIGAG